MRIISGSWLLLCLFVIAQQVALAQIQPTADEIPTIAYCDLVNNAVAYHQKIVRLKVVYFVAFEVSVISDPACDGKGTWVQFDTTFNKNGKQNIRGKFDRLTDARPQRTKDGDIEFPSRQVEVVWVGRFESIKPTQTVGDKTFSFGFGHLNAFDYQFTALEVERVEPSSKLTSKN
jgi:hypothetical protein